MAEIRVIIAIVLLIIALTLLIIYLFLYTKESKLPSIKDRSETQIFIFEDKLLYDYKSKKHKVIPVRINDEIRNLENHKYKVKSIQFVIVENCKEFNVCWDKKMYIVVTKKPINKKYLIKEGK